MTLLPLTIGLNPSPYTQALFDGSVRVRGIDLNLRSRFGQGLNNVGARHRAIIAGEVDGGELSISSFILARLRGVPLRALPVFLSRRFRLRCMYCRTDSPVHHPSELGGRSVTVHRYNATTPVWLRGILQNEFGVRPSQIDWYVAEPDIAEESHRPPPPEVRVNFIPDPRTREHAVEMVQEGKIEAALEPYQLHDDPKMRFGLRGGVLELAAFVRPRRSRAASRCITGGWWRAASCPGGRTELEQNLTRPLGSCRLREPRRPGAVFRRASGSRRGLACDAAGGRTRERWSRPHDA